MPLAAHARWAGADLVVDALLGHPTQPDAPLLRASVQAAVADEAAAEALGERAAALLHDRGAAPYLQAAAAA